MMPGKPFGQMVPIKTQTQPVLVNGYVASTSSAVYLVAYINLPDEVYDQEQIDYGFDLERDYMLDELKGKLISEQRVRQGKMIGREVIMERNEATFIERMYYKNGRFYATRMVIPRFGYPTSFVLKINKVDIDRYFNSFKILQPPGAQARADKKTSQLNQRRNPQ